MPRAACSPSDLVTVATVAGQAPKDYADRSENLAHAARGHTGHITCRYDIAGNASIHDFAGSLPRALGAIIR